MTFKIYVGNLPFATTEAELNELFSKAGEVALAKVVRNSYNNKSKGYGFVEMATEEGANEAIRLYKDLELSGRPVTVEKGKFQGEVTLKPRFDRKRPLVQAHANA